MLAHRKNRCGFARAAFSATAWMLVSACQYPLDEAGVIRMWGSNSDRAALDARERAAERPVAAPPAVVPPAPGGKPVEIEKEKDGKKGGLDWGASNRDKDGGKFVPIQAGKPPHGWPQDRDPDRGDGPGPHPRPRPEPHSGPGSERPDLPRAEGPWAGPASDSSAGAEPGVAGRRSLLGDSCVSAESPEAPVCLGLRYVVYLDRYEDPVETDRDAIDSLREVNQLWRGCGIQFQIERYEPIRPEAYQLRYRTAYYQELDQIRERFQDDRRLLVVMTGKWNRAGSLGNSWANAWTNLPGQGLYGAILERPVSRVPNVLAHELGHYLSLDHVSDSRALMNPVIYRGSSELSREQCESARWAAGHFWKKMMRSESDPTGGNAYESQETQVPQERPRPDGFERPEGP